MSSQKAGSAGPTCRRAERRRYALSEAAVCLRQPGFIGACGELARARAFGKLVESQSGERKLSNERPVKCAVRP